MQACSPASPWSYQDAVQSTEPHRACLVSDGIPAASKQLQDFIFVAQHLAWLVVTWTEYSAMSACLA